MLPTSPPSVSAFDRGLALALALFSNLPDLASRLLTRLGAQDAADEVEGFSLRLRSKAAFLLSSAAERAAHLAWSEGADAMMDRIFAKLSPEQSIALGAVVYRRDFGLSRRRAEWLFQQAMAALDDEERAFVDSGFRDLPPPSTSVVG